MWSHELVEVEDTLREVRGDARRGNESTLIEKVWGESGVRNSQKAKQSQVYLLSAQMWRVTASLKIADRHVFLGVKLLQEWSL